MKIRFNPKSAQIEFESRLEQTTFERYYPIPQNTQMEIKIDFVNSISQRKRPDVRLSYIKLSWNSSLVSTMLHVAVLNGRRYGPDQHGFSETVLWLLKILS
jgi:hypothetical protein